MVKAVSKYPEQIEFTICCREKEWLAIEKEYEIYCRKNIKVVHKKVRIFHYCMMKLISFVWHLILIYIGHLLCRISYLKR